jgi:hypothetical protein
MRGGGLRCLRAALAGTDRHNRAVITVFPATFPDGMTPADPYGPWHALAVGGVWILGLAIVGAVGLGLVALFEARKLAKAHRGRPLITPGRDWRREAVPFTTRAVAFCSIFALVPAVTGALRMTPSDAVTSTLWAYEGDATVVDASSGKNPWVRLSLESGQEVVLKGLSTFELNEDFDNGDWDTPRHVTVRCQAWHRWFPGEGGYVSAWCENPRFGEE